jgi:Uma2 family endonuclease
MIAIAPRELTPADLLAMPESERFELVDGELVEKAVSALSSFVEGSVYFKLRSFCDAHGTAVVFPSSNGIQCFPGQPNKVRRPDVAVFKKERFTSEHFGEGFVSIAPDLAVEVISPNDEASEVNKKVEEYLAAGVALVWVIDPVNEIAYVHRKDGSVAKLHRVDTLDGEDLLPGFQCKLVDVLATA